MRFASSRARHAASASPSRGEADGTKVAFRGANGDAKPHMDSQRSTSNRLTSDPGTPGKHRLAGRGPLLTPKKDHGQETTSTRGARDDGRGPDARRGSTQEGQGEGRQGQTGPRPRRRGAAGAAGRRPG